MPTKIKINYERIEELKHDLLTLNDEVANEGAEFARSEYSPKVYVFVTTQRWRWGEGRLIIARGFTMPFEEYGAGILAITDVVDGVVVGPDTWSVEHKQEYHRWGYWTHNGETFYYVRPRYAMHDAIRHLQYNGVKIAQRHFRSYL